MAFVEQGNNLAFAEPEIRKYREKQKHQPAMRKKYYATGKPVAEVQYLPLPKASI
jgi:hypothetical protein